MGVQCAIHPIGGHAREQLGTVQEEHRLGCCRHRSARRTLSRPRRPVQQVQDGLLPVRGRMDTVPIHAQRRQARADAADYQDAGGGQGAGPQVGRIQHGRNTLPDRVRVALRRADPQFVDGRRHYWLTVIWMASISFTVAATAPVTVACTKYL